MKDDDATSERMVTAADRLDKAMDVVEAPVRKVSAETHRLGGMVRLLLILALVEGLGLAGLGWVALVAHDASDRATAAILASCEATNDFRRLDLARWLYVLDLSKEAPLRGTPAEQRAQVERSLRFENYVRAADELRDCEKPPPPGPTPPPTTVVSGG